MARASRVRSTTTAESLPNIFGFLATPSRLFLLFWLSLIIGLLIANFEPLPVGLTAWFGAIWLVILISGQEAFLTVISTLLVGVASGVLLWQVTGGEPWLHWAVLGQLQNYLLGFRDQLVSSMIVTLPEPHGTLLAGILFGNRLKLDPTLLNEFRIVGLSHIVAVSGYNLTILTANVQTLLRPVLGRKAAFIALAAIVGFVLISGAPSSILRAAVMAVLVLVAEVSGRPSRALNLLIIGAGVLVLFEPKIISDIGFQLSVAATYGLLRLSTPIERWLHWLPVPTIRQVLAETLGATIVTAPIIVAHFEQLSLVSPLSNILVLPLMPLLMGIGIIGSVLALIIPAVGYVILLAAWPVLEWIVRVTHWLASWPGANLHPSLNGWLTVGVIALILVISEIGNYWLEKKRVIDE